MNDFPFQEEYTEQMRRLKEALNISPGDIYEDCACHPVLCVNVDYEQDHISGISLIDGSYPRSCSLRHCGVRKITVHEAWDIRIYGPTNAEYRDCVRPENKWWHHSRDS